MVKEEDLRNAIITTVQTRGDESPEIELEETISHRWSGFVASGVFDEMSQIERQDFLWEGLEKTLTPDQLNDVLGIVTVTPEEIEE